MKRVLIGFISLAAILFSACSEKEEPIVNSGIYGIVTDMQTTEPIRGAQVVLSTKPDYYSPKRIVTSAVTGDEGQYEFIDVESDSYVVALTADGYNIMEKDVEVSLSKKSQVDFNLEKIDVGMNVLTKNITISGNSATLEGEYTTYSIGFGYNTYSPTEVGFAYSANSNPANGGTKVSAEKKASFNITIKDLLKGTYYVQAYATNERGTIYGEVRDFQISGIPSVLTLAATNVSTNAATLNGKIEYPGDPAFTERGFVYSSSFKNPTIEDDQNATIRKIVSGTSIDFSANITGLTTNATYYARAYIINSDVIIYGEAVSFKPVNLSDYAVVLQSAGIAVQKSDISSGDINWTTANSLCASSTIGGFDDWRLPTVAEATTIYNNSNNISGLVKNSGSNHYDYWTSTSYNSSIHYQINMTTGEQTNASNSSSNYKTTFNSTSNYYYFRARCVRSLE